MLKLAWESCSCSIFYSSGLEHKTRSLRFVEEFIHALHHALYRGQATNEFPRDNEYGYKKKCGSVNEGWRTGRDGRSGEGWQTTYEASSEIYNRKVVTNGEKTQE